MGSSYTTTARLMFAGSGPWSRRFSAQFLGNGGSSMGAGSVGRSPPGTAGGAVAAGVPAAVRTTFGSGAAAVGFDERISGSPAGSVGGDGVEGGPSGPAGLGIAGRLYGSTAFDGGCSGTGSSCGGPLTGIRWSGPFGGI